MEFIFVTLPWVEKYRPKKRSDLIGNTASINSVYIFLKNWRLNSSKPGLILLGPPGSGKTSAVLAISKELGYELIEINASDSRNKKSVKNQLGKSARSVNTPYKLAWPYRDRLYFDLTESESLTFP